jgi:iron complex transport system ATP-binding protein
LDDVSFHVDSGEHLAIIGPNGADKTSLLRCIARLYDVTAGQITVEGRPASEYTRRDLAQRVSYVPQADGRPIRYTVWDFILMARYPHLAGMGRFGDKDYGAVLAAMEKTGTAPFAKRRMDTLSGGERQTVFIAAALAQGANILILDEPTTFLDYKHQGEILDLMTQLHRDEGLTIISVTHDLNHGASTGDRVLALKEGKSLFFGEPDELREGDTLRRLYDTDFEFIDHTRRDRSYIVPRNRRADS